MRQIGTGPGPRKDFAVGQQAMPGDTSWIAFVEEAEQLTASLDKTVEAIAGNKVDSVECEIKEQQARCTRLLAVLQVLSLSGVGTQHPVGAASYNRRLGRSLGQLRRANDRYRAVLEHSGKTHRMLLSLAAKPYGSNRCSEAPGASGTFFLQG